ncbi:GGDEF domain-containing protein [Sodalinema gerasimenkoae]|uniref:GGDEF domain-containing protein n=1 Tax=Sodalinema gerasimenkoae TaxID=2862348 RepID=UPI00135B26D4|nr:GGDEF domain-containing protein [Sodalinema gerasimenkoae]
MTFFNPDTMILMIAISSLLQAAVLVVLWISANQYKGMSTYVLGTLLSSLSFVGFLVRSLFFPSPELRLINNIVLFSAICLHIIGIGQFLSRKINYSYWLFAVTLILFFQIYWVYYDDNYFWRNVFILVPIAGIYAIGFQYIQNSKIISFRATSRSLELVLGVGFWVFIMRIILIRDGTTQSIIDETIANAFTFLSLFVIDFLRNGFFVIMVSQRMYAELHHLAEIDFLTQIFNRGATARRLERKLKKAQRHQATLILLDIDYFKKINDNHGHDVGDRVLQEVARVLESQLTPQDILGRWGGEEFVIFLPNCSAAAARDRAESLRLQVEKNTVDYVIKTLRCTISLGVVTAPLGHYPLDTLLKQADLALYQAKENGRNRAEYVIL